MLSALVMLGVMGVGGQSRCAVEKKAKWAKIRMPEERISGQRLTCGMYMSISDTEMVLKDEH